MSDTFKRATKAKLRFGNLTTEDLWDLDLKSLDRIGIAVNSTIESKETTFLSKKSGTDRAQTEARLKLNVIKEVIETKEAEIDAREAAANKKAQKEFLTGLLEKKKTASLESLSEEEISKKLAELDS
jgi:hypothetical protein